MNKENGSKLISVIVPIYNVEAYLERCVRSIQSQTYAKLEIILVDDGSPDGCGELCDRFAKEDNRIRVIHKENGGLSDARNAGLDIAVGEYVVFVDSDDYIAPYFVETLYKVLTETDSDVAMCSYTVVEDGLGKSFEKFSEQTTYHIYDRQGLLMNLYDANHEDATYFIVAWNKLYKKALWDNIRFPKGKIHEDEATTYKIYDRCQKGVYIKVPMYGYFTSTSSITRDAFSVRRLEWMDALNDRIAFFEQKEEHILTACSLRARADGAIKYYYPLHKLCKESGAYKEEKKRLKTYVKEALFRSGKYRKLSLKTKIGYAVFLLSPGIYRKISGQSC